MTAVRHLEAAEQCNDTDFHAALRVITFHEPMHFSSSTDGVPVPVSAMDGLYMACRGLAVEVVFKGGANIELLERIAASWCTTMRIVLAYNSTSSNIRLTRICSKSRTWIQRCIGSAVEGHVTWPFWKALEKCLNWCCLFHTEGRTCPYGSSKFGHLLAPIAGDCLMRGSVPSVMSWSHTPCLLPKGALDSEEEREAAARPPAPPAPARHRTPSVSRWPNRGGSIGSVDRSRRPRAVVGPNRTYMEYAKMEAPEDLFDGPPFEPKSPLRRDDLRDLESGSDYSEEEDSDDDDYTSDWDGGDDDQPPQLDAYYEDDPLRDDDEDDNDVAADVDVRLAEQEQNNERGRAEVAERRHSAGGEVDAAAPSRRDIIANQIHDHGLPRRSSRASVRRVSRGVGRSRSRSRERPAEDEPAPARRASAARRRRSSRYDLDDEDVVVISDYEN
uniref:Uncharacterized protein n=1 Tax=Anatid alphaherpesvirus 2 TaxID=3080522 RepID=A0AAU0K7B4_9ALPH